jgi:hypothetical protein
MRFWYSRAIDRLARGRFFPGADAGVHSGGTDACAGLEAEAKAAVCRDFVGAAVSAVL